MRDMVTVAEFIRSLGGTSKVAKALSIPPQTVSSWKASGNIPKWRRGALFEMAAEQGAPLPAFTEKRRTAA